MKNKIIFLLDVIAYFIQILLMISFSKYTHNNSLYSYFLFSFIYNIILSFCLKEVEKSHLRIILLNLFFAITVYYFGNLRQFQNDNLLDHLDVLSLNVFIFVFFGGNWILPFLIRRIIKICKKKNHNELQEVKN